jgi:molecular chaperone GrpE (heat shock protein)
MENKAVEYSIQELILLINYFEEKYNIHQKNYQKAKEYLIMVKIIEDKLLSIGKTFKTE